MFYKATMQDHVRVDPKLLGDDVEVAITKELKKKFDGYLSKDVGSVVDVLSITNIGDGVLIPGDSGPYYDTKFEILVFKPELNDN